MKSLKKFSTKHNDIWFDENDILRVAAFEKAELDLEETKACFDIYRQLGCDKKKALQLIFAKDNMTMTAEAREFISEHGWQFFIASAVVNNSLAIRLVVNFFNSFYKHKVPFKMFSSEEAALKWLNSFR